MNLSTPTHVKGVVGDSTHSFEYGYKQSPLDTNAMQVRKLHKGARNDHAISGSSDEDFIITMGGLVQARKIGSQGVCRDKASDGVTKKILVASSGKRILRELEDFSNVRAGVGTGTSSK